MVPYTSRSSLKRSGHADPSATAVTEVAVWWTVAGLSSREVKSARLKSQNVAALLQP